MSPEMRDAGGIGFSLVRGGLFYAFERRVGIVHEGRDDTRRQSIAVVLVAWVPLVVFGIIGSLATGQVEPLLADFAVHVRFLFAVPCYFVAERWVDPRVRRCVDDLAVTGLVQGGRDPVARIAEAAARARDAHAPETFLLVLAVLGSQAVLWNVVQPLVLSRDWAAHWSAAKLWYGFVALPIFQFLTYRWLWRWALWSSVLWRISRLPLRPMATHADRCGGLSFLGEPAVGFSWFVMGFASLTAAGWANQVAFAGARIKAFAMPYAALVAVALLVSFAPLFLFVPRLMRARMEGKQQYGRLGLDYTQLFHRRWIEHQDREGLLGTSDIQSLADLGNSYEVVHQMRPLPIEPRPVVDVVLATLLPMVPLILTEVPLRELLRRLGSIALGGLP